MADAKVRQLHTPRTFDVKLTEGEIDFWIGLLGKVGGDTTKSPNKYAIRIKRKLVKAAGYDYRQTDAWKLAVGSIYFNNYGTNPLTPQQHLALFELVVQHSVSFMTQIREIQRKQDKQMQRASRRAKSTLIEYLAAAYQWGAHR